MTFIQLLLYGLYFVFRSSGLFLTDIRLSFGYTLLRQSRGEDFNLLEICAAGRIYLWVQGSRTYSPQYSWPAITSDSSFMRSNCRPQSELGLFL